MTSNARLLMLTAAERLTASAQALFDTHTVRGQWQLSEAADCEAFREYHEDLALAQALTTEALSTFQGSEPGLPWFLRRQVS